MRSFQVTATDNYAGFEARYSPLRMLSLSAYCGWPAFDGGVAINCSQTYSVIPNGPVDATSLLRYRITTVRQRVQRDDSVC